MADRLPPEREAALRREAVRSGQWRRSERRQERIASVVSQRQPDLTLVLEDVHDVYNVGAILRTADAAGVMHVHAVYQLDSPPEAAYDPATSASAAKWVSVSRYGSIEACYTALRAAGFMIAVTALTDQTVSLYQVDFTRPVALVLGAERRGASAAAVAAADVVIGIPMRGMVQSLNVSVAATVALYEAVRQREAAGMYDVSRLTAAARSELMVDLLSR